VVSTHLKHISQIGNLPQIGVKKQMFETTTPPSIYVPGSFSTPYIKDKLIPPLMTGILINGYINHCYWVDGHPLVYGNNGEFKFSP